MHAKITSSNNVTLRACLRLISTVPGPRVGFGDGHDLCGTLRFYYERATPPGQTEARGGLNEDQKKEFKPVHVEVKAGEAIFHHSLTLHGSGENKSNQARRAFVINAFADGVRSDSDSPMLEGVPPVAKGEKMEGQFFPLLYKPL